MRHVTLPPGESDRKFLPSRSGTVALEVNRLFRPYNPSTGLIELCQGNAQTTKPYLAEVPGSDDGKACRGIAKCWFYFRVF